MARKRASAICQKAKLPPFAVLRIAAAKPPIRSALFLFCLLGRGAAEGVGIASPIAMIIAAGGDVLDAIAIGLPTGSPSLLCVLVFGPVGKAPLSLLATRHVGHAVADVGTRMRMILINALLEARWGFFVHQPVAGLLPRSARSFGCGTVSLRSGARRRQIGIAMMVEMDVPELGHAAPPAGQPSAGQ